MTNERTNERNYTLIEPLTPQIHAILKDSNYNINLFREQSIINLENKITQKQGKKGLEYFCTCQIRDKEIKLTPEEIVRQLYLDKLIHEYGYPIKNIQVEIGVQKGRENTAKTDKKRIDILVSTDDGEPYIVVEVKKPKEKDGSSQLESYIRWENAPLGVLCNGDSIEDFYYNKENKNQKTTKLEKLSGIPHYTQSLSDFLERSYTLKDLFINDELQTKTLKKIILDFEDVVLANSGVDSFEEIFKLIFTKLYDEHKSAKDFDRIALKCEEVEDDLDLNNHKEFIDFIKTIDDKKFRRLEFRTHGTDGEFKKRLTALFNEAKEEWGGIFEDGSSFELTPEELKISVSYLQDIKLFNSNFEVVDDAFEYLVTKSQKGDKGQYFTPRYVIDMCVRMLNPQAHEKMIDTASGSCGFPMHCILYVWNKLNPNRKNLITAQEKTAEEVAYIKNVFAIDFDKKSVRIGRLLNKIAGDGETNVLQMNSLHYKQWKNDAKVAGWENYYKQGFLNFEKLCADTTQYDENYAKDYSHFNFDIVMANPPFAGDISNENLWKSYELGKNKISRDILFIERNLNMLKSGGRMAIVLPQGRFNNSSDKYIREFIAEHARILAVVGLHGNVFKPHTGTKTSVLFVQKWDDKLCPKTDDYPIFFATMSKPSKDNSGDKIYLKNEDGSLVLDTHGHLIVDHDLYNHDGLTQDGIAEAFIDFAKEQGLSFWRE
ncbi:MAG: N-6 DNA methylase [Neisseriaceae bacterium]|nr:N-6 DNA methylase [Neisseriaceae bacterium]